MPAVALSAIRSESIRAESDVERLPFERLAVTLSLRFAKLHVGQIAPAIAGALEQVARAVDADAGALVEFGESGAVETLQTWPDTGTAFGPLDSQGELPRWRLERLARHEVVAVSPGQRSPARGTRAAPRVRSWRV